MDIVGFFQPITNKQLINQQCFVIESNIQDCYTPWVSNNTSSSSVEKTFSHTKSISQKTALQWGLKFELHQAVSAEFGGSWEQGHGESWTESIKYTVQPKKKVRLHFQKATLKIKCVATFQETKTSGFNVEVKKYTKQTIKNVRVQLEDINVEQERI